MTPMAVVRIRVRNRAGIDLSTDLLKIWNVSLQSYRFQKQSDIFSSLGEETEFTPTRA